jgi:hypothetical protein
MNGNKFLIETLISDPARRGSLYFNLLNEGGGGVIENSELPMRRIAGAGLRKRILRIWPLAFRALCELSGPGSHSQEL